MISETNYAGKICSPNEAKENKPLIMTILEFNKKIKSKTTFNAPIKYGDAKLDKRSLFSYTIYDDKRAREIRFTTKEIFIYEFDQNNFLKGFSCYNSDDSLKFKTKFELISKEKHEIRFKDWTPGNGDGNHGTLIYLPENQYWKISFPRVDSFLGYKKVGILRTNELGDFAKEEYYDRDSNILEVCLINEYEYFRKWLAFNPRNNKLYKK